MEDSAINPSPTHAEYPSARDLYQTNLGGPNHSIYIDDAIVDLHGHLSRQERIWRLCPASRNGHNL